MSFREKFANPVVGPASFQHRFIPFDELEDETIEGYGRFYTTPNGVRLPSVTTVIGKSDVDDDSWLSEWIERVGEEEAARVSGRAKSRGTALHAVMEDYLLNKPDVLRERMPYSIELFGKMRPTVDRHVDCIMGIEMPLWSERLRTAGRCDLLAQWDGVNAVIDWKTASKPKQACDILAYFIQATTYGMMVEERTGGVVRVPRIVIGIAVDHDEPQFFVRNKVDFLEDTLRVFVTERDRIPF